MNKLEQLLRSFSDKCHAVSLTDINRYSYWHSDDCIYVEAPPIHIAANKNDLEGMRALLDNGADVNLRGRDDYNGIMSVTALHSAARAGDRKMLQLLLERDADVNAMNQDYETPLHNATSKECISMLVAAGARADGGAADDARTPLHDAVGWYIWSDMPKDALGRNQHMVGSLERIKALLEAGANVNAIANVYGTSLHHFLECAKKKLLKKSQESDGILVVHFMSVLSLLLKHGADVNARRAGNGRTPLHIVMERGLDLDILDQLLRHGACVNASDSYGHTPLYVAVRKGRHEHVERLLQAGADASIVDVNGRTAVDLAKDKGNAKILSLLSDNAGSGHDTDQRN